MICVSGRSEPAFIRTSSLSLFSLSNKTQNRRGPGGFVLLPIKCFSLRLRKSPRQSFSAYRRENKLQSVFSGDMCTGKKHFSARQCGIGSPFDPILHAAGCFSLSKMQAFSRMSFTIPSQKIRTLSITLPQGSAMMYVSGRSEYAFIRTSSLSLFSLSNNTQSRRGPHPGGFVPFTVLMGSAPRPGGPCAAPAARQRPAEEPAR